jgi:hypothetical protein
MSDPHEEINDQQDGEILMGRWDCDSCDTKGHMGDCYKCPNCGSQRPEDVKFYLPDPDNAQVISDEAGIKAAEAGADWKCDYCDSWMAATVETCTSCGGGEEAGADKQKTESYDSLGAVPKSAEAASPRVAPLRSHPQEGLAIGGPSKNSNAVKYLFVALALMIGFCLLSCLFSSFLSKLNRHEMTVVEHSWTITRNIQQFQTLSQGGWKQPADAVEVTSQERVHHHNEELDRYVTRYRTESYRVQDGYTTTHSNRRVKTGSKKVKSGYRVKNLGNGRFKKIPKYKTVTTYKNVRETKRTPRYINKTRQVKYKEAVFRKVPVHQLYYSYKVNRWKSLTPITRSGTGKSPQAPPFTATSRPPGQAQINDMRLSSESALYTIKLQDDHGHVYIKQLDKIRWDQFNAAQKVIVKLDNGHVKTVMTLDEASKK